MMTYPNAAAGLKTLYQAKLVGLISIVLVIVPIVQVLAVAAMLIAGFLALVGLAQCRKDDKGYRTAFNMVIAGLVTNLAASLVSAYAGAEGFAGICGNILSIATDVLSLASLYFVCITTNRLLKETAAAENLIDRGIVVWKLNVVCTVILLVLSAADDPRQHRSHHCRVSCDLRRNRPNHWHGAVYPVSAQCLPGFGSGGSAGGRGTANDVI